jgi:hypothetical protein
MLRVFEIGEPVFELTAQRYPIRLHGAHLVEDAVARQ